MKAQSGNIQAQLVQLWCVKSNLHLSWDLAMLAGDTGSWAYTLYKEALLSNNATFDMSPFHSMLKSDDMKTTRIYNWIIYRIQRPKSFSFSHYPLPPCDSVKYITGWWMGRGWVKRSEVQRSCFLAGLVFFFFFFSFPESMRLSPNSITG